MDQKKSFKKFDRGVSLIEVLVVVSMMTYIFGVVISNFYGSRINMARVANVMVSDIRLAQNLASTAAQYKGSTDPVPRDRCGYGITKPSAVGVEDNQTECSDNIDNDGDTLVDSLDPGCNRLYHIYAGPPTLNASGNPVACGNSNYSSDTSHPIYLTRVLDVGVDLVDSPAFRDIFYMPPGPTTYINNSNIPLNLADPTTYYEKITIKKIGVTRVECDNGSSDCIFICVYYSGRIEVSRNTNCPTPY